MTVRTFGREVYWGDFLLTECYVFKPIGLVYQLGDSKLKKEFVFRDHYLHLRLGV